MEPFDSMTQEEAIAYCHKNANKFKAELYAMDEDGERQFGCLLVLVEDGTVTPAELPDYGMDYEEKATAQQD